MKELSLNILDISENSVKAGATLTEIILDENDDILLITIQDNGCGMDEKTLKSVTDPFYTTRTTRKVGMGLPLLKLEAEQTGGKITIESKPQSDFPADHGTVVRALFYKKHLDFTPLGDAVSTLITLIQGHPNVDFYFKHTYSGAMPIELDTRVLRDILENVPLNTYEVINWIESKLREQYSENLGI